MTSSRRDSFSSLLRQVAMAPHRPTRRKAPGDLIGRQLGPYLVEAWLGEGGMGIVYRASDTRVNRRVALKVLLPTFAASEAQRRLLLREAQAAFAINHPNVAAVYELREDDGVAFLVMELVHGERLRDRIPPQGFPWAVALRIGRQLAAGLAAAHRRGIVHRDLKPENVMISYDGNLKILDFGLAKPIGTSDTGRPPPAAASAAATGPMVGTRRYLSPEQASGGKVDARADVFSFGVVFNELLTGRLPESQWGGGHDLPASVPHGIASVVRRCLATLPWERVADGDELERALYACEPKRAPGLFGYISRASLPYVLLLGALVVLFGLAGGLMILGALSSWRHALGAP